ncbi:MAG: PQQ-binding-like beta-propeller repeat protein, partial [Bauldia sp.]
MNSIRLHSALPAPRRALCRAAFLAAAIVAVSGCSTVKGWFDMDKSGAKAASKPLELVDFVPSATVARMWTADAGAGDQRLGLAQSPTIADGRVYAAAADDTIRAFDLQTGAKAWEYR